MNKQIPVCGSIVAIMWQEVIIQLPEHMKSYPEEVKKVIKWSGISRIPLPSIWRQYIMVCLSEHVIKVIKSQVVREELVGEAVHFDKTLQLHYSSNVSSFEPNKDKYTYEMSVILYDFSGHALKTHYHTWPYLDLHNHLQVTQAC